MEYAKYSEFSNLAMANLDNEIDQRKAYSYLDRALYEINKEFNLNQAEEIIYLKPNISRYFITSLGMLKVLAAFRSDGSELSINKEEDVTTSVFTPSLNVIEFYGEPLDTVENDFLSIMFLEKFAKITSTHEYVRVTETYMDCLLNYMGFLAHSAVSATKDSDASEYMRRYMAAVETIKSQGINYSGTHGNDTRLHDRGFV